MSDFQIKDQFYLDEKPFKILSGAIHYFRVHPDDWYHSLFNLKALGFNTVETYVPWNLHESKKGHFCFDGILDVERFLRIAQELGLYAIVRPSPLYLFRVGMRWTPRLVDEGRAESTFE